MKQKTNRDFMLMAMISLLLLAVLVYAARQLRVTYPEEGTGEYRLPVFGTSDIHGCLVDSFEAPYQYRLAYIADKVDDARMTEDGVNTDRTILIDGGDIYQGNAESLLTKGEALSAVFDSMQYDAVGVGNHEFDWGIDTVFDKDCTMRDFETDGKKQENDIPVVCSNIYLNGEKLDCARDYVILEKKAVSDTGEELDVKVAVIGFADDYAASISDKLFTDLGYTIELDYDELNRMAAELEENDECDATILLAHGAADEMAEALGSSTPIDLVYGGHTHKNIDGTTEWGLRYLEPTSKGYSYLYSELAFTNDGRGGAELIDGADDNGQIINTAEDESVLYDEEANAEELDRGVIDTIDEYLDRLQPYLDTEIGYVTEPATKKYIEGSDKRTNTVSNMVCDALRRETGFDVAFINTSGVRSSLIIEDGAERRTVTLSDIYSMIPFDDELYFYEITYAELLDICDYAMTSSGRGLLKCETGVDIYFRDDPIDDGSSGSEYKRRIMYSIEKDGTVIWKDGVWTDGWEDKKLKLVTIDFIAESNRNAEGIDNPLCAYNNSARLFSSGMMFRDAVIKALESEAAESDGYLHVDQKSHMIYLE